MLSQNEGLALESRQSSAISRQEQGLGIALAEG